MQQALAVIESKQQRADQSAVRPITKAADHAVRTAIVLHLHHRVARARRVSRVVAGDSRTPLPLVKIFSAKASNFSRRSLSGNPNRDLPRPSSKRSNAI